MLMVSSDSHWKTQLELHQTSSAVTAPTLKRTEASHHSALGMHSKTLAVWKVKLIWGCIGKSTASRLREVFIPFGLRGEAHLKCWSHSGLLCASNTNKLEEVQQRAMEVIKEREQGGTFRKRLREEGIFQSLEG